MPKLHISRLRIDVYTEDDGTYGVDIPFSNGLNVIHADNTFGKSTCIQAIVYGLGLEGALGPSRKVPLKSALTRRLKKEDGGEVRVIESRIYLELKSKKGIVTICRSSSEDRKDLIMSWDSPLPIDHESKDITQTDFYVRLPGAAQRDRGFHHFLADFIGVSLPKVETYEGKEAPLYMECIFPLFYVEQTRGWGGIQNVLPTYFGIKDLSQRTLEYVLNLDAYEVANKKIKLQNKKLDIERSWTIRVEKLENLASRAKGHLTDLPEKPTSNFDFSHVSELIVYESGEELTIKDAISKLTNDLNKKQGNQDTGVDPSIIAIEKSLKNKLSNLNESEVALAAVLDDIELTESYISSITQRIISTEEDLRRYKDIERLWNIGSNEKFDLSKTICPTCGQEVEDSLLPHVHGHQVLTIEDNITYLDQQQKTLKSLLAGEQKRKSQKEVAFQRAKSTVSELRAEVRSLKASLITDGSTQSKEAIRREVLMEERLVSLTKIQETFYTIKSNLGDLSKEWNSVNNKLSLIPGDGLTEDDHKKLNTLQASFKKLLSNFGYSSTPINEFEISTRTYKPAIDNVELGAEASASDNIRMIWSYLYSLMIIARDKSNNSNHFGILILDEPRQQEARDESFKQFMMAASDSMEYDQQVIIGTSEKSEDYQSFLEIFKDIPATIQHFSEPLISPRNEDLDSSI